MVRWAQRAPPSSKEKEGIRCCALASRVPFHGALNSSHVHWVSFPKRGKARRRQKDVYNKANQNTNQSYQPSAAAPTPSSAVAVEGWWRAAAADALGVAWGVWVAGEQVIPAPFGGFYGGLLMAEKALSEATTITSYKGSVLAAAFRNVFFERGNHSFSIEPSSSWVNTPSSHPHEPNRKPLQRWPKVFQDPYRHTTSYKLI